MTKIIRICLLALPLAALPCQAQAAFCRGPFGKYGVDLGASYHLRIYSGSSSFGAGGPAQAGPWYSYWPYEAHFQTPAPVAGYPFWPTPSAVSGVYPDPNLTGPSLAPPGPVPTGAPPAGVNPAAYYYPEVPSYWYGH